MLEDNQVWGNTSKIAKLEKNNGEMRAVIFKIKLSGLQFDEVISNSNEEIERYLKKLRMRLTNKILTIK